MLAKLAALDERRVGVFDEKPLGENSKAMELGAEVREVVKICREANGHRYLPNART